MPAIMQSPIRFTLRSKAFIPSGMNPLINMINYKYVAAEIVHTIVGSIGLVAVAPFTALCSGFLLTQKRKNQPEVGKEGAVKELETLTEQEK